MANLFVASYVRKHNVLYSGIYKLVAIKHNVANMIYMVNLCKPFFIVVAIVLSQYLILQI